MAKKLEDLLQPGEQVVFRTRHSVLGALGWSFLTLLILYAVILAINLLARDPSNPLSWIVFALLWIPLSYFGFRSQAALLTDQRFLHSEGIFKPSIEEVPLADIYRIEFGRSKYDHAHLTITRYKGRQVHITVGVPKRAKLACAIAAQAGVTLSDQKAGSG